MGRQVGAVSPLARIGDDVIKTLRFALFETEKNLKLMLKETQLNLNLVLSYCFIAGYDHSSLFIRSGKVNFKKEFI